jgi:hypothetical protein
LTCTHAGAECLSLQANVADNGNKNKIKIKIIIKIKTSGNYASTSQTKMR